MVQSAAHVSLSIGKRVAQLGLLYIWLVVALSLFEATRGATQRLTGWVVTPASQLVARLVTTLPLLVVFLNAAAAVWVLLQFVTLYFSSIARGETRVAAIPPTRWWVRSCSRSPSTARAKPARAARRKPVRGRAKPARITDAGH